MTNAERGLILKNLTESRERLLRVAEGLSPEQVRYRPGPDRWSIAENLEHITVVEGRMLGFIRKALETAPDSSKRGAMHGQDDALIERLTGRTVRRKAPEPVPPTGRWKDEELLREFEATRQRTREFVASTDADLRQHFSVHGAFGELDCYQWLLIIGLHCDRHRAQSEEVMATDGFPRTGKATA